MDDFILTPAPPEEAAPFYERFLAACPDGRVGYHLKQQVSELQALCANLDEEGALFCYQEGKWSIKEVIGHILDTERVLAYRLLRIGRKDSTPLGGFDETAYVPAGQFNHRSIQNLLAEFALIRGSTLALAQGIPQNAWDFLGIANGYPTSARALVFIILGHTAHHLELLQSRYGLPVGKAKL